MAGAFRVRRGVPPGSAPDGKSPYLTGSVFTVANCSSHLYASSAPLNRWKIHKF
jgi:hypothetical protein